MGEGLALQQRWRHADVKRIDEHLLSARAVGRLAGALLVACGGLVGVTAVVLPYRTGTSRVGLEALALAAMALGAVAWFLPWGRWGRSATLWLVPPTMALVATHDHFVLTEPLRYGLFYVVIFAWLGLGHGRRAPLWFAPVLALAYIAPLAASGDNDATDLTSLAYVLPLCVLLGETVAWVSDSAASARAALGTSERSFRRLFESNPHPMWVYEEESLQFLEVNAAAVARYGYSRSEFLAMTILDIRPSADQELLVQSLREPRPSLQESTGWRHRLRDGSIIDVDIASHRLTFEDRPAVLVTAHDVTERNRMERELREQAIHDPLTGLGNRVLLADRVAHALLRGTPGSLALLLLDLDGFKTINDSLGHSCGDELLVAVATRLRTALSPADTVARLGGDEFVVLIEGVESEADAIGAAQRVMGALAAPFTIDDREVITTTSIGIAMSGPASTYTELLRNADTAMYRAKSGGGAAAALFEREMHLEAYRRLETLTELRRAIDLGEIIVHYQPIVSLRSANRVVGVEALARWQRPHRGLMPPLEFIPLAEESGIIVELGRTVLATACLDVATWNQQHPTQALNVSVNLSARQIADPDLLADVESILTTSGLSPNRLTLEITETVVMADTEHTIAKLHALKALGVHLAIDDFGTGYSSLAYLRRMPLDVIKIDKTFTDVVPHDVEGTVLVKAILRIADTLHLDAVAEGVENAAQMESLARLGCPLAQGYTFSKPLPFDELATFIDAQTTPSTPKARDPV